MSRNIAAAALVAGTVSGLPSTAWAVATGRSAFEAAQAAGTLVPGRRFQPNLLGGCAAHVAVSAFWTTVIATVRQRCPMRPTPTPHPVTVLVGGAAAGLLIATLDLAVLGRRYPAIRALPQVPQWCDHVMFGITANAWLARRATCSGREQTPHGQRRRR